MLNEMRRLVEKLNYYTKNYDEGYPLVSDEQWDKMYFDLQKMEKEYHYHYPDSPTQKVSYEVINALKKVEHNHLMLSLNKTKNIEDIVSFVNKYSTIAMPKMDGLTCSLRYMNGELVSAETRGDGTVGEDILHNAKLVKNIPCKIPYSEELIIDGEIICRYDDFEPFLEEYAHPRNFAAGSIRLLDSKESQSRNLSFVAWDVIKGFDDYTFFASKLELIKLLGFTVVETYSVNSINLEKVIERVKADAHNNLYPIDGVVFKVNLVKDAEKMGNTDHHFNNAIAFKFYDEGYETTLENIEWSIGRSGQITPIAIYKDVTIDGTICNRASLHNLNILKETLHSNGWKGQKIKVAKINMIIPQIIEAEEPTEEIKDYFEIPSKCPECGSLLDNQSGKLFCLNSDCPGRFLYKVEYFCSKKGMDIKGLSEGILEKLIDWGWLKELKNIYELSQHKKEWEEKPGFGKKSVSKLLLAIEDSENATVEKILCAAGIPLIGTVAARTIGKSIKTYEDFRNKVDDKWDFTQLKDFGESMNSAILNYNYSQLDEVVKYLTFAAKEEVKTEDKLSSKTFVITGKVSIVKNRAELQEKIEAAGGKVLSAISNKVDYLINNDINSTSAKNIKAKELNIPVITEEQALAML